MYGAQDRPFSEKVMKTGRVVQVCVDKVESIEHILFGCHHLGQTTLWSLGEHIIKESVQRSAQG